MKNITPNLFIIGAPKSGTTGLVASLKEHPDIFVPEQKEPRFFDAQVFFDYPEDYPLKSIEDYLSLYANNEAQQSQYRVDGSVFNMYSQESIKNILNLSPDAKFILILRDPLSATKSMFLQRMKYINPTLREISEDFGECWELSKSRHKGDNFPKNCRNKFLFRYDLLYSYELYIPYIKALIPEKNLKILSYRDFKENPVIFYKEVIKFLSLNPNIEIKNKKENSSYFTSKNSFTSFFDFLSHKTLKLRKKIGFHGKKAQKLKNLLLGSHQKKVELDSSKDKDISIQFKKTYEFLKQNNIKS